MEATQPTTFVEAVCGECFELLGGDDWGRLQLDMLLHVRELHDEREHVVFSLSCTWPVADTTDYDVVRARLTAEQRRALGEWDRRLNRIFAGCDRTLTTGWQARQAREARR